MLESVICFQNLLLKGFKLSNFQIRSSSPYVVIGSNEWNPIDDLKKLQFLGSLIWDYVFYICWHEMGETRQEIYKQNVKTKYAYDFAIKAYYVR